MQADLKTWIGIGIILIFTWILVGMPKKAGKGKINLNPLRPFIWPVVFALLTYAILEGWVDLSEYGLHKPNLQNTWLPAILVGVLVYLWSMYAWAKIVLLGAGLMMLSQMVCNPSKSPLKEGEGRVFVTPFTINTWESLVFDTDDTTVVICVEASGVPGTQQYYPGMGDQNFPSAHGNSATGQTPWFKFSICGDPEKQVKVRVKVK